MKAYRKNGIVVGVLFILCTVASIAGGSWTLSILEAPDYIAQLAFHRDQAVTGALIELIWAAAGVGIAIGFYPVIRRHGEGLALGSVIFRGFENMAVMISTLCLLSLLALGSQSAAPAIGGVLIAARGWAQQVVGVVFFCLGALLYYSVLYRSRLIPRWLSGWGLGAAVLSLIVTVTGAFDRAVLTGTINTVLNAPLGLQEMVLAVWLIVKGFNPVPIASLSATTDAGRVEPSSGR